MKSLKGNSLILAGGHALEHGSDLSLSLYILGLLQNKGFTSSYF